MSKPEAKFKDRLREVMEKNEWRSVDVVERTGIHKATISQYLHGKIEPHHERLVMMADVFGVSPAWLMGYRVDPTPQEKKRYELKGSTTMRLYAYIDKMTYEEQELMLTIAESVFKFRNRKKKGAEQDV